MRLMDDNTKSLIEASPGACTAGRRDSISALVPDLRFPYRMDTSDLRPLDGEGRIAMTLTLNLKSSDVGTGSMAMKAVAAAKLPMRRTVPVPGCGPVVKDRRTTHDHCRSLAS